MLKEETTKQTDALEVFMLKEMDKCDRVGMDEYLSELSINCLTQGEDCFNNSWVSKELDEIWQYKALEKRAEHCITVGLEKRVLVFLTFMTNGVIGKSIQYLYFTQYLAKKQDLKFVTFEDFCQKLHPHGFLKDEDLERIWYDCKVKTKNGSKNLIDYGTASLSIQFKK